MNTALLFRTAGMAEQVGVPSMKKLSDGELRQSLVDILFMQKHPHSKRTDAILDKLVTRSPRVEHIVLAKCGLMDDQRWPLWMRLVQIRYVKLVCKGNPKTRVIIKRAVKTHCKIDEILREVLRCAFMELHEWDTRSREPKLPRAFWEEACKSLQSDIVRWTKRKTRIGPITPRLFQLFGVEFNLSPTEWLCVSEE